MTPIQPIRPIGRVETKREYRMLTVEEVNSSPFITQAFAQANSVLPDPAYSQFIACVEDGEVVGFLVVQLKLHAEPLVIKDGYSDIFLQLVSTAERVILERVGPTWVYLFAPAGRVSQLATHCGMQLEPWNVLSKFIMPDPPARPAVMADFESEGPPDGEMGSVQ